MHLNFCDKPFRFIICWRLVVVQGALVKARAMPQVSKDSGSKSKLMMVPFKDIELHSAYHADFLKNMLLCQPNRLRLTDEAIGVISKQVRLHLIKKQDGDLSKFLLVSGVLDFQELRARSPSQRCHALVYSGLDDAIVQRWVQNDCFISPLTGQLDSRAVHYLANYLLDRPDLRDSLDNLLPLKGNDNLATAVGISTNSIMQHRKKKLLENAEANALDASHPGKSDEVAGQSYDTGHS
jgi:hypothetical protein